MELSEFSLEYRRRGLIKAQVLAIFIAELLPPMANEDKERKWTLYVDNLSNNKGSGAGVILEDKNGVSIEQSLRFMFKTSNNQVKYEALLAGLKLAKELGVQRLVIKRDSELVIGQGRGEFQVKEPLLQQYLAKVKEMVEEFEERTIEYIRREHNS